MIEPDDAEVISVLEAIANNESIEGFTIGYWAHHAKCRIEQQAAEVEALKRENNELRGTSAHIFDELLAWYSTRSKIERHLEKVTKLLEETK